jgi:hypothetical protein
MADAVRLLEIHTEMTGSGRGRRHNYDALSRSAVILAVAAWEGFAEDLVLASAGRIVRRLANATALPSNVRDGLISYLHDSQKWSDLNKNTKETIWGLTGEGWRTGYITFVRAKVTSLHTPNFNNLRKLFSSTCGLQDFTVQWGNGRWGPAYYQKELDAALEVRHLIAHGSIGKQTVGKAAARDIINNLTRFAEWTDKAMSDHLAALPTRPRRRMSNLNAALGAPLVRRSSG